MLSGKWKTIEYKGQYPIAKNSVALNEYRKWVYAYWKIQKLKSYKLFGKVMTRFLKLFNNIPISDPALKNSCYPTDILDGFEPVCHFYLLKAIK